MSQNSRPVFTLPEKHHQRLRKGLEIVISVDCSFRVNSDTTKHLKKKNPQITLHKIISNRPFPHSASVRSNNSTRARLGWTFSYICCIFVHPDLDSALLFAGIRERSIRTSTKRSRKRKGKKKVTNHTYIYIYFICQLGDPYSKKSTRGRWPRAAFSKPVATV